MKRLILLSVLPFLMTSSIAIGDTFTEAKSKSMFTDIKAHKIGDLITVFIVEDASASNKAKATTKKSTKGEVAGGPGMGGLKFFAPFGMSAEDKNEFDGEGRLEKNGSIRAKMTVRIIGISENGDLIIEGSRVMNINSDKETLHLSGIVRVKDVTSENTIYSYQIADAQVSFNGKGQTHDAARPGLITRIVNWIF